MPAQIRRWGNSAAVRIPASVLDAARLRLDDAVTVRGEGDGRVVIERAASPEPHYTLEELLEGMTEEHVHGEVDWGPPVGREVW